MVIFFLTKLIFGVNFLLCLNFACFCTCTRSLLVHREICSIYFCTNKLSLVLSNYTLASLPPALDSNIGTQHKFACVVSAKILHRIAKNWEELNARKRSFKAIKIHGVIKTRILESPAHSNLLHYQCKKKFTTLAPSSVVSKLGSIALIGDKNPRGHTKNRSSYKRLSSKSSRIDLSCKGNKRNPSSHDIHNKGI